MGPSQKAVGRGLFLGVWSAQSKEVLPSLTSPAHTSNLIFLYSSGKSRLEGDFLQPQEGIPKDKKEVLKLLSSCALVPAVLRSSWDSGGGLGCIKAATQWGMCKVLHMKRRIKAVTTWRERNQGTEWLLFAFPGRNNFGETHFAQEPPDVFSRPLRSSA